MAGLAAAYEVTKKTDCALTLFEASGRLGGTVETVYEGGFTIETGPDSWVSDRSAVRELAEELGLGGEILYSNDAIRRNYLVQSGSSQRRALTPMPDGMRMMVPTRWLPVMESPLFSWQARLAYLREPKRVSELKTYAAARGEDEDESVRSFVTRHFGVEATETIAGPLLAGVFGGDIDTLSAGAVLAPFVRQEREHGSLIASAMAQAEKDRAEGRKPQPVFTTVRGGLQTIVNRVEATLPAGSVRKNTAVTALARESKGWDLAVAGELERFDAVVLATPAHITRALLEPVDAEMAELLRMEATSAIVVALCFAPGNAGKLRVPRGFGFLVPPSRTLSEKPELLAGTFMDQKFPDRAPAGGVFLRGFFGGHAAPRMMDWEDAWIAEAAHGQFAKLLGPLPVPAHTVVRRWPRSLPQYAVGHPGRMRKLEELRKQLPGLALTGNAYSGVGLPALVHHAQEAVRALLGLR